MKYMDGQKNYGLLEYLAANCGCMYISDLHQPEVLEKIKLLIPKIDPYSYSVWEWNDAVSYITGSATAFETRKEAVDFLIKIRNDEKMEDMI